MGVDGCSTYTVTVTLESPPDPNAGGGVRKGRRKTKKKTLHRLYVNPQASTKLQTNGVYAVDIMVTLTAIAKTRDVARCLHGPIHSSPKRYIFDYMDTLMESIGMVLQNFKLIFVFDGMRYGICRTRVFLLVVDSVAAARYPYKGDTHATRVAHRTTASRRSVNADTLADLNKLLVSASHYNGTIIYYVKQWLASKSGMQHKIKLFGAPFEAEAQCTYLENAGIADGVLSSDSDMVFHGVQTLYSGLNTRTSRESTSTRRCSTRI